MAREPVVIEGRGDPTLIAGLSLFSLFFIILALYISWNGSFLEIAAMLTFAIFLVAGALVTLPKALVKKRFAISDVGLEYWKGNDIAYQVHWEAVTSIEALPGEEDEHTGILVVNAKDEDSFNWKLMEEVAPDTLREVFRTLEDWVQDHPHVTLVNKGFWTKSKEEQAAHLAESRERRQARKAAGGLKKKKKKVKKDEDKPPLESDDE